MSETDANQAPLRDTRADTAYFQRSYDGVVFGVEHGRQDIADLERKNDRPDRYARDAGIYFGATFGLVQWSYSTGAPLETIRDLSGELFDAYCLMQSAGAASRGEPADFRIHRNIYSDALRALSLAILFEDRPDRVTRMVELTGNDGVDAVYDRLAASRGVERMTGTELAWPKPYARLLAVFAAEEADRPARMKEFLKVWYAQNRSANWWGQHLSIDKGGLLYTGYWCYEAAAVVKVLGIDDSLFRDNEYYPADLLPRMNGATQ